MCVFCAILLIFVPRNESVDRFEQLATTEKNAKTRLLLPFSAIYCSMLFPLPLHFLLLIFFNVEFIN